MPRLDDRDMQAMRLANDYTLDPDERARQIDALYADDSQSAIGPEALAYNDPLTSQFAAQSGAPTNTAPVPQNQTDVPTPIVDLRPGAPAMAPMNPESVQQGFSAAAGAPQTVAPTEPESTAPGQPVDPSKIRFAGGSAGAPQANAPFTLPVSPPVQSVRVGTNTFQPVQRTIQGAQPIDPEIEARQQEAEQAQLTAFDQEQTATQAANLKLREEDRKNQHVKDEARKDLERQRQYLDDQLAVKEKDYQDASDDLSRQQAAKPFNANRFWEQKSTGDKIMTGLAMFLGTLGSGLAGTQNVVWDKIKGDIANDIDEQKAEHDARVQGAATKAKNRDTIYQQFKDRGFSDLEAKTASMQAAMQAVDQEFARMQENLKDPISQAQAAQQRAKIQQDIATADAQRQSAHVGTIQEVQRYDPERWVTSSGGPNMAKALQHAKALEGIQEGAGVKYLQALGYGGLLSGGAQGVNDETQPTYVEGLGHARVGSREASAMHKEQAEFKSRIAALDAAEKLAGNASSGVGAFGMGTKEYNDAQVVNEQLKKAGVEGIDVTKWTGDQPSRIREYKKREIERWQARVKSTIIPGGKRPAKQKNSAASEGAEPEGGTE